MQMLQINQVFDAWFNKGFKGPKCKTLLKLASSRIKLLRNKREINLKQLRRELAQLLENGQESTAHIRVEHIIREKNIVDAYDCLEHFCELLIVRMPIMESQRECPLDLKEAVASLIFAAPRASDLPELLEVQNMLSYKYGREFVTSAAKLQPDSGVSHLVIEKLSAHAPTATAKLNLMKEIAEEYNIEWDPANTELEFSKAPQDLLDGPNQFIGAIQTLPIPSHGDNPHAQGSLSASSPPKSMPAVFMQSMDQIEEHKFIPFLVPPPNYGVEALSSRFYSPPRESSIMQQSDLLEETLFQRTHSRTKSEGSMDLHNIIEAAEAAAESAEKAAQAARAAAELLRTKLSRKSFKSVPQETMLQNESVIPSTLKFYSSGNMSNNHLTPDSYNWTTQEYEGKQQQENDTMLHEERVEDKTHQEMLFASNGYDWTQDSFGRKEQQNSYDWTQDSYGRKQEDDLVPYKQEDDSLAYKQHNYIFDKDKNDSADEMSSLHLQTPGEDKESVCTPSSRLQHEHSRGSHQSVYDVPKFDGSEMVTHSNPFHRQPSLEDDPFFTYPNLFSKSSSG